MFNFITERTINIHWQSNFRTASALMYNIHQSSLSQKFPSGDNNDKLRNSPLLFVFYGDKRNCTSHTSLQGRDDKNANKSDETETAQKRWDKGLCSSEEESPKHTLTRSQDLDDQAKFLVGYVSRFGRTVKTNKKFTWL